MTANLRHMRWITRDGEVTTIAQMSDGHLRNAIFYIHRRAVELGGPSYGWGYDMQRRVPVLNALLEEAQRRNLPWVAEPSPNVYLGDGEEVVYVLIAEMEKKFFLKGGG